MPSHNTEVWFCQEKGVPEMATLKTRFEELEVSIKLTSDRAEQDAILDQWIELRRASVVESELVRRHDPDRMGRRSRTALEGTRKN